MTGTHSGDGIHSGGLPTRGYEGFGGVVDELASRSTPSWVPPKRATPGAPNVVVLLLDDMGYSDLAAFGGEIRTPTMDRLAAEGLRLTNFHTPPVCSPARAALLTGLNPHRAGFATVAHFDPGYPGYALEIGEHVPTIAESFRAEGYATFMVGKWHLTKESHLHDGADKSSWPIQRGFDHYYGSMDGFTSLHHPHRLVRDNSPVTVDEYPDGYYLTDDLTDQALGMINDLRASDADRPFFLYFAHQAVHAPLQAKADDIERYRHAYDAGWDVIRRERFARQQRDGLFAGDTEAAGRNTEPGWEVPAWDDLSDEQRSRFARYMEVYAAVIDNVDQNLARLVDHLERIGEYDNTIIVVTSDNGGSGEGGPEGTRSYFNQFVQLPELSDDWERDVDRDPELIGGPRTFVHYPRGWGYASNTPFRMYKGHTFDGGIRSPLIISWPDGLPTDAGDNRLRHQYAYMNDLGQTLLDLTGVPRLTQRHGRSSPEVDGTSFAEVLRDGSTPSAHPEQYTEYSGNRAFSSGRWKIVTEHPPGADFGDHEWQLFDVSTDPTETTDLAAQHPDVVAELAAKWRAAAWNNTVFPLDDDGSLVFTRPDTELALEQPVTIYPGTATLERYRSAKLTLLRSFEATAVVDVEPPASGVLFAHGDQGGGYVVFIEDGAAHLTYNEYGRVHRLSAPLTPGENIRVGARFTVLPDFAWSIDLCVDDTSVARLDQVNQLIGMSPFTGISVGVDRGGPVDWELHERHGAFRFSGRLHHVRYVPGPKADYNPEVIVRIQQDVDRIYD